MSRYNLDPDSGLLVPRKREIIKPRHCSMGAPQQALLGGGASAAGDPYWSNVVLLCHFDGTNGQTTTVDSSSAAHGITGVTGLNLSTTKTKFGATSSYFGGSAGSCSWGVSDSDDWNFGSGQFTIECFLNIDSSLSGNYAFAGQFAGSGSNNAFTFCYVGGLSFYYSTTGSNGGNNVTGSWTPSTNTWYHIAVDRDASNVLRVYVDGVVKASATVSATFFNSTAALQLGCDVFASRLPGYIDELRITKGVARYAGAFTPPTAAFPNS